MKFIYSLSCGCGERTVNTDEDEPYYEPREWAKVGYKMTLEET